MKQWQRIIAVCAASVGLGLLVPATSALAAGEASKANLVAKPDAKDLVLKGDAKCTGCHDEADEPSGKASMLELNPGVLSIATTRHGVKGDSRTPTCTDCHGDSEKHRGYKGSEKPPHPDRDFRAKTETPAAERSAACLACHKGEKRAYWEGTKHASNDVSCNNCHKVHSEQDKVRSKATQTEVCFTCHKEQRADSHKVSSHPIGAGKVTCSDCHNTHGSGGTKSLVKNTVNETCFTCHAEKRGPFLFEHRPASEDCASCHMPHGSNISPMLKSRSPFMCQECHDGTHASGSPVAGAVAGFQGGLVQNLGNRNPSANNLGAGCLNCHRQIHGSNSPAGGYFQR